VKLGGLVAVIVLTAVKNDLLGLLRTEKSIVDQSKVVEWVLVTPEDNSSTFHHATSLLASGLVKEIIPDAGNGVYSAMNQAIDDLNPKDFLWFLNAGDTFADESSYATVSAVAESKTQRWIYGGHFLGSESGEILGEVKSPAQFKPSNQLFSKRYVSHQSTIFNIAFLQELGGFFTEFKIAADWDLLVRASLTEQPYRIPEAISIFYMGGLSSKSRQVGNRELFRIRKRYLSPRYLLKNYWWFTYRTRRNEIVIALENASPSSADLIRKVRLGIKNR
jgi:GT2 family glycosyltransferase